MHPLFQNKVIRFGLMAIGVLAAIFVVLLFLTMLNSSRSSTGLSSMDMGYAPVAPSYTNSLGRSALMDGDEGMTVAAESSYYYPPEPQPDGYTSGLESYETSSYSVTARTKEFDALCDTIAGLKADSQIHFKSLTSSTNNCRATFYVTEDKVASTLGVLTAFRGVEVSRNTESVTRHKQQLENQTQVLQQQLASVSRSLTATEIQFDEIAAYARAANDASTLSKTIREKLSLIEQLTQQKIYLTSQLNNLYQQAADLEERLGVVQFDVTINRAHPIYPNQDAQKWGEAWEELKNQFTDTLIGLTAFFGIFLLRTIQVLLYLLVIIVILRGLWKFGKLVWSKW